MTKQRLRITGARDLTEHEIEQINRIKAAEKVLLDELAAIAASLTMQHQNKRGEAQRIFAMHNGNAERAELQRFEAAEPFWWITKGKRDIQIGVTAAIRAIEQPAS